MTAHLPVSLKSEWNVERSIPGTKCRKQIVKLLYILSPWRNKVLKQTLLQCNRVLNTKDVEPFTMNSAYEFECFEWSRPRSFVSLYIIVDIQSALLGQIPDFQARFCIDVNGPIFKVQIADHSQSSLKIIFTWKYLDWGRYLMQLKKYIQWAVWI